MDVYATTVPREVRRGRGVSYSVGTRSWTQVLLKNSQCSFLLSQLPSSNFFLRIWKMLTLKILSYGWFSNVFYAPKPSFFLKILFWGLRCHLEHSPLAMSQLSVAFCCVIKYQDGLCCVVIIVCKLSVYSGTLPKDAHVCLLWCPWLFSKYEAYWSQKGVSQDSEESVLKVKF